MREYREGNDEVMPTADEVTERRLKALEEAAEEEKAEEAEEDQTPDFETAFLVVKNMDGTPNIITEISNLKLAREATPSDVNMLLVETLEAVRVSRMASAMQAMILPQVVQANRQLLLGAKGGFRKGPTKK